MMGLALGAPAAPAAWFEDVTAAAGVDFRYETGADGAFRFPEIMGGGAALLDYDGDGWLDLYLVQGGDFGPGVDAAGRPQRDRLYRNVTGERGALAFVDVTEAAGIEARGYGQGVAAGDYDGDGDADLYVLNFGPNQLWRNDGDGTFTDVTEAAGVGDPAWSVSGTIADLDGDGDGELVSVNYVDYSFDAHRDCQAAGSSRTDYCSPSAYAPVTDTLYRNDGNDRFSDVTSAAGMDAPQPGLGVVAADFDADGRVDLYVANDGEPNQYWLNRGNVTFIDEAFLAGNAVNASGAAEAGMGVDAADPDRTGSLDLFVTHLVRETNTLYLNDGKGWFTDATGRSGLGPPSLPKTGFGTAFVDFDRDGWLDLYVANGAVVAEPDQLAAGDPWPYRQPDQLFAGVDGRTWRDATAEAGPALDVSLSGRGAAFGDLDNDGAVDVVVAHSGGPIRILRNVAAPGRHWLGLSVETGAGLHGTALWLLDADGRRAARFRPRTDGSYASASDARVVVGLGDEATARSVEVTWPDGTAERFDGLAPDRYHALRRGRGTESPRNPEP